MANEYDPTREFSSYQELLAEFALLYMPFR